MRCDYQRVKARKRVNIKACIMLQMDKQKAKKFIPDTLVEYIETIKMTILKLVLSHFIPEHTPSGA